MTGYILFYLFYLSCTNINGYIFGRRMATSFAPIGSKFANFKSKEKCKLFSYTRHQLSRGSYKHNKFNKSCKLLAKVGRRSSSIGQKGMNKREEKKTLEINRGLKRAQSCAIIDTKIQVLHIRHLAI